jgi:hypothetical protein
MSVFNPTCTLRCRHEKSLWVGVLLLSRRATAQERLGLKRHGTNLTEVFELSSAWKQVDFDRHLDNRTISNALSMPSHGSSTVVIPKPRRATYKVKTGCATCKYVNLQSICVNNQEQCAANTMQIESDESSAVRRSHTA